MIQGGSAYHHRLVSTCQQQLPGYIEPFQLQENAANKLDSISSLVYMTKEVEESISHELVVCLSTSLTGAHPFLGMGKRQGHG